MQTVFTRCSLLPTLHPTRVCFTCTLNYPSPLTNPCGPSLALTVHEERIHVQRFVRFRQSPVAKLDSAPVSETTTAAVYYSPTRPPQPRRISRRWPFLLPRFPVGAVISAVLSERRPERNRLPAQRAVYERAFQ